MKSTRRVFQHVGVVMMFALLTSGLTPTAAFGQPACAGDLFPLREWIVSNGTVKPLALGDMDKDGDLDAVTSSGDDSVAVVLNMGGARFPAATEFAGGDRPVGIALADLNGDGDLDVGLANIGAGYEGTTVSILLGNGNGTLGPEAIYQVGLNPNAIAFGDLDGDGDHDMIVPFYPRQGTGTSVAVRFNSGAGTFGGQVLYHAGTDPRDAALGDLDADGDLDIVVTNGGSSNVSVFINNGNGTFADDALYAVTGGPGAIALGDLNSDGTLDITCAVGNVSVLLNEGRGTFGADAVYPAGDGVRRLALGDLDGDGELDIAATRSTPEPLVVLPNVANGAFGEAIVYAAGRGADGIAIGDLDAEGNVDIAVANASSGTLTVQLNPGDASFTRDMTYGTGDSPWGLAAGDLDADGDVDVVIASEADDVLNVHLGGGNGTLGAPVPYETRESPRRVALGDLDGDGDLDIAATNAGNSSCNGAGVGVYINHGDATFEWIHWYPQFDCIRDVALGDADGDGALDLWIAAGWSVSIRVNNGQGAFAFPISYLTGGDDPVSLALDDLDGDGDVDAAVANRWSDDVSVLLNDGDGILLGNALYDVEHKPELLQLGDFDEDGKPDIAVANEWDDSISLLLNAGDGTFGGSVEYDVGENPMALALGDLDGDDHLDVIAANNGDTNVSVLSGNGDGTFDPDARYGVFGEFYCPKFVTLADMNGDGRLDVLAVTPSGTVDPDRITILLNECTAPLPGVVSVASVAAHGGGIGEVGIPADADATLAVDSGAVTTEPRLGGIHELRVTFADPLDPAVGELGASWADIASQPPQQPPPVTITTQLEDDDTTLAVMFDPALPNSYVYSFELSDSVIAAEAATPGDRDFQLRALVGNVASESGPGPQAVNAIDLGLPSGIRGRFGADVSDPAHAPFDVNQDGAIDALDYGCVRLTCGVFGNTAP